MVVNLLRQSIISTLAYFDLSDYPLTKEELFSWLWQPPTSLPAAHPFGSVAPVNAVGKPAISYPDFLLSLRGAKSDEAISLSGDRHASLAMAEKFGFYFLPGREAIVEVRRRRLLISEQKLKIARRAAKIIRSVPFLRAVFVCNTTGSGQANEDSDIDFFIITEKNRIWITRLLVTFLLELFRLRRVGKRVKNKICLSFYVTVENLDLAKWRVADDDIHFAYWLNQMLPIFDPENYYLKFLQANSWTKTYLPNLDSNQVSSYLLKIPESRFGKIWKKSWEKMWQGSYGDLINTQAKKIQLAKIKFSGKPIDRGEDKGVVISDGVLKFHEKDTRLKVRQDWKDKIYDLEKSI